MLEVRDYVAEAEALISELEVNQPPLNVYEVLRVFGIDFELRPLRGESLAGTCYFHPEHGPHILVNRRGSWRRQRFTAAHELKHALFDPDHDHATLTGDLLRRVERDANIFAANLLMPEHMVRSLVESLETPNMTLIAEVFGVSYEAAWHRVRELQLASALTGPSDAEARLLDEAAFAELRHVPVPESLRAWARLEKLMLAPYSLYHRYCPHCRQATIDPSGYVCWRCAR